MLVHGFTQTLRVWAPVAERLAGRFEVVRVDLPGHGGSGGVRAGFEEAAGLVGEAGGAGVYVGYSLGGRLCLRLALERPDLVRRLVLIGASPGIADPGQREARRDADEALARRIERDGVAVFLDAWLAGPLFSSLPVEAAGREERLANTAEGLAYALRRLGTGVQEPLWDRLGELRPPVLLMAGELDRQVRRDRRGDGGRHRPGRAGRRRSRGRACRPPGTTGRDGRAGRGVRGRRGGAGQAGA